MKPADILATKSIRVTNDPWELYGVVQEIDWDDLDAEAVEKVGRIEVRKHLSQSDGYRGRWVSSAWFDHKPVVLWARAGRDGKDEAQDYILNKTLYVRMVKHLMSFYRWRNIRIVSAQDDLLKLNELYGQPLSLDDFDVKRK